MVVVADEGRGMLPRTDSPGLGLGLPLIAQMTQSLEVHDRQGGGTEIRMSFALRRDRLTLDQSSRRLPLGSRFAHTLAKRRGR